MEKEKLKKLWEELIKSFRNRVSKAHLLTYFQVCVPLEINDNNVLIMAIPNAFIRETLEKKYGEDIFRFFKMSYKNLIGVEFITKYINKEEQTNISSLLKKTSIEKTKGGLRLISVDEKFSLSNLVVSDNNELAYAASRAVSRKPGTLYNPLFIYGGVGLGKTHLLQGIANQIKSNFPDHIVVYATAENFTNNLIDAIHRKNVARFRKKYRDNIDVLILDDIQFIEGKERTQEELFHTFNVLSEAKKQIIFSSDRPPVALKTLDERLRSRFASGMVADVIRPDIETRIAILRSKLQQKGYLVSPDVLQEIAEHVDSNVRELEAVLKQIVDEAELLNIDPTLELARNIIIRLFPEKKPHPCIKSGVSMESIINHTSEYFSITPDEITGHSRKKKITTPRHIAMYLIREILLVSLEKIGEVFGGRNHTTVMHATSKTKKLIKTRLDLVKAVNAIKKELSL